MYETLSIPAAVDVHSHLREPSTNRAETIKSGSRALMLGGFAVICDMPNNPGNPTWTLKRNREKQEIVRADSSLPIGLAVGSQPEESNISEFPQLAKQSVFLKSYLGETTNVSQVFDAKAFMDSDIWPQWHKQSDKPILVHLGSADAEEVIGYVSGDLGHKLHICHVNSPADVKATLKAKVRGLPVTCGVTPHHLFMSSHDYMSRGAFADMKPPLAHQTDAEQLWYMLTQGAIDIIETDHAPHSHEAKMAAEQGESACFGVPGGEFTMPLLIRRLVKGDISLERLVEVTSNNPAKILGIKLSKATKSTWELKPFRYEKELPAGVETLSKWNPFLGMMACGKLIELRTSTKTLVRNKKVTGSRLPRVIKGHGEIV